MKVILYHQDGCPQCRMVEVLLDRKNIEYESCKDVKEMKELGITHTPALKVDDKLMQGKEMIIWINQHESVER